MKTQINIIENPKPENWGELLKRPAMDSEFLDQAIRDIFFSVKRNGDRALLDFTKTFDGVVVRQLCIGKKEIDNSEEKIDSSLKDAIKLSADNIEKFHSSQKPPTVKQETTPGVVCWQKAVPIQRVGLYIPGGSAPLFSSLLMLAIPAKIAGCKEVIVCTPPGKDGTVNPAILYAAKITGVDKIYTVGGAQAVAAMAFGTETIRPVNKIFGPGNQFVTAAKQAVQKLGVAIDMPAGPSELMVMADKSANPEFVAADMLSQAEHGADSQVILLTNDRAIADNVINAVELQIANLPRKEIIEQSLESCKVVVLKDEMQMMEMANEYAPEHLIVVNENKYEIAELVENAGSVFLGNYTPESAGDYATGTNHTLPTNGAAKAYSGVNLDSFVKKITFQEASKEGFYRIGKAIEVMAEAEQLQAHKKAVTIRLNGA